MSVTPLPLVRDDSERQARIALAALYRLFHHYGWTDTIETHLSMRVPGTTDQYLINPYGLLWEEVTASSLVKIDGDGNKVGDNPYPVNLAGFTLSNHELSAFFRKPGHKHFREMNDQVMRKLLQGLQMEYRPG